MNDSKSEAACSAVLSSAGFGVSYVVVRSDGEFFHFFDRNNYGEPQFGDLYHAKRYRSRAGAGARVRALEKDGESVTVEVTPNASVTGLAPRKDEQ